MLESRKVSSMASYGPTTSQKRVRSGKRHREWPQGALDIYLRPFRIRSRHPTRPKKKRFIRNNEKGRAAAVSRWGGRVRTCVRDRNRCGSNPATLRGTAPAETHPLGTSNFRGLQSRSSLPCPRGRISREKRGSSVLPSRNEKKERKKRLRQLSRRNDSNAHH